MKDAVKALAKTIRNSPFAHNVLTLQFGGVFTMGIGFAKSIIIARMLGLEGFGMYAVVIALTATLTTFINFGQNQAALIFFAEEYAAKNKAGMQKVVGYFLLTTSAALCVITLLIFSAPIMVHALYGNTSLVHATQTALIAIMLGSMDALVLIALQTMKRVRTLALLENANLLLELLFTILFLHLGYGILGPFYGMIVGNIIMICVYLYTYKNLKKEYNLPGIIESLPQATLHTPYIKQGLWIAFDKNFGKLYPQGFIFALSLITSVEATGLANLAFKLGQLPNTMFLPHISRMAMSTLPGIAKKDPQHLKNTCAQMIKHTLLGQFLLVLGSLIVIPIIVLYVYGISFSSVIQPALFVALIQLISPLKVANSSLYRMFHKANVPALWNTVAIPTAIIVLVLLSQIMNPLNAFVFVLLIDNVTSLWLTWYAFERLIPARLSLSS